MASWNQEDAYDCPNVERIELMTKPDETPQMVPLTPRQEQVLARIGVDSLTQIGEAHGITRARVGQVVKRLHELGLVERDAWGWKRTGL